MAITSDTVILLSYFVSFNFMCISARYMTDKSIPDCSDKPVNVLLT